MKVSINLSDKLLSRIDKFADNNSINRTSAISVLLTSALRNEDMADKIAYDCDKVK